jgi:hypothetical protein
MFPLLNVTPQIMRRSWSILALVAAFAGNPEASVDQLSLLTTLIVSMIGWRMTTANCVPFE